MITHVRIDILHDVYDLGDLSQPAKMRGQTASLAIYRSR